MKGLELSKRFFFDVGLPKIQEELPDAIPYLAAGLSTGSQCHGNDDEVSRDHGWGLGFTIWLNYESVKLYGNRLQEIVDSLPSDYLGFGWNDTGPSGKRSNVLELDDYVKRIVPGFSYAPTSDIEWLRIEEKDLFEITHKPIFIDASGEVTRRFNSFREDPADVWKKRLSANLAFIWNFGGKSIKRSMQRGHIKSALLFWPKYVEHVMKVCFLLNHEYHPYDKWFYIQFSKLPKYSADFDDIIFDAFKEPEKLIDYVESIDTKIIQELISLGFAFIKSVKFEWQDFRMLNWAQSIHNTIENPKIRGMHLFTEKL